MAKLFWKSLRSRILLLAVLTLLFLAGAAASFFASLRSSHTATLAAAERHLVTVASHLAHSYIDRTSAVPSLDSVKAEPAKPGPPPPPLSQAPHHELKPPPVYHPRPRSPISDPLTALTFDALRQEPGIEGGFFAAGSKALVGYAFPTHEGPGPSKEMPQREQPTIEKLVENVAGSGALRSTRFEGPHDAVLFVAAPIQEAATERLRRD